MSSVWFVLVYFKILGLYKHVLEVISLFLILCIATHLFGFIVYSLPISSYIIISLRARKLWFITTACMQTWCLMPLAQCYICRYERHRSWDWESNYWNSILPSFLLYQNASLNIMPFSENIKEIQFNYIQMFAFHHVIHSPYVDSGRLPIYR